MSNYNDALRDAIAALYQVIDKAEASDEDLHDEIILIKFCVKTLENGAYLDAYQFEDFEFENEVDGLNHDEYYKHINQQEG